MTILLSILTCRGFNVNCDPNLTFPQYILFVEVRLKSKATFLKILATGIVTDYFQRVTRSYFL